MKNSFIYEDGRAVGAEGLNIVVANAGQVGVVRPCPGPELAEVLDTEPNAGCQADDGQKRGAREVSGEEADVLVAGVAVHGIVRYLVDHFPETVYNLPPDPKSVPREREGA